MSGHTSSRGVSEWLFSGSRYLRSLQRGRARRLHRERFQHGQFQYGPLQGDSFQRTGCAVEALEDRSLLTVVDFQSMIAEVTATSDDGDVITAFLRGSASIDVGDTPTQTADGRDVVQTEIVSMNLQGFDSFNGPLVVRVSSMTPSIGATAERRDVSNIMVIFPSLLSAIALLTQSDKSE